MFLKGRIVIVVKNTRSIRFNITNDYITYYYIVSAYKLTEFDTEAKSRFSGNQRVKKFVSISRNDGQCWHLPVQELIQKLCEIPTDEKHNDVRTELCRAIYSITRDLGKPTRK